MLKVTGFKFFKDIKMQNFTLRDSGFKKSIEQSVPLCLTNMNACLISSEQCVTLTDFLTLCL